MATSADIHPARRINNIAVPDLIAEGTGIQGFVFSRKFLSGSNLSKYANPKTSQDQQMAINAAKNAWKIAEKSDGGPGVGENYISIKISDDHSNAGSRTEKIYLYFGGQRKYLRLWGLDLPFTHKLALPSISYP